MTCKSIFIFLSLLILMTADIAHCAEPEIIEVQASGRGADRTQAMRSAIEEAVRQNLGSLIMSREILSDDKIIENIIQVSRGSVAGAEILSESTEKGEVRLDVKFKINKNILAQTARKPKPKQHGGINIIQQNYLQRGISAVNSFFSELELIDFIDVSIDEINIDLNKGQLSLNVKISFNQEKYFNQFAPSLTFILDNILNNELEAELEGANQAEHAIYLMGRNRSFSGWVVPEAILDAIIKSLDLELKPQKPLVTQRRLWINIALLDAQGRELPQQRIPVSFPVTNILLFSLNKNNLIIFNKSVADPAVIIAPCMAYRGHGHTAYREQRFIFEMPREILRQVRSINSSINLEY